MFLRKFALPLYVPFLTTKVSPGVNLTIPYPIVFQGFEEDPSATKVESLPLVAT
jgi:hypothetical protein